MYLRAEIISFCNMATLYHTCRLKWMCFSEIKWVYVMDQFEVIFILISGELLLLLKNLMLDPSILLFNFDSEIWSFYSIEEITEFSISSNTEYQQFQQHWGLIILSKLTHVFFTVKPWCSYCYFHPMYR